MLYVLCPILLEKLIWKHRTRGVELGGGGGGGKKDVRMEENEYVLLAL